MSAKSAFKLIAPALAPAPVPLTPASVSPFVTRTDAPFADISIVPS